MTLSIYLSEGKSRHGISPSKTNKVATANIAGPTIAAGLSREQLAISSEYVDVKWTAWRSGGQGVFTWTPAEDAYSETQGSAGVIALEKSLCPEASPITVVRHLVKGRSRMEFKSWLLDLAVASNAIARQNHERQCELGNRIRSRPHS
jgi:hypothetical protein